MCFAQFFAKFLKSPQNLNWAVAGKGPMTSHPWGQKLFQVPAPAHRSKDDTHETIQRQQRPLLSINRCMHIHVQEVSAPLYYAQFRWLWRLPPSVGWTRNRFHSFGPFHPTWHLCARYGSCRALHFEHGRRIPTTFSSCLVSSANAWIQKTLKLRSRSMAWGSPPFYRSTYFVPWNSCRYYISLTRKSIFDTIHVYTRTISGSIDSFYKPPISIASAIIIIFSRGGTKKSSAHLMPFHGMLCEWTIEFHHLWLSWRLFPTLQIYSLGFGFGDEMVE